MPATTSKRSRCLRRENPVDLPPTNLGLSPALRHPIPFFIRVVDLFGSWRCRTLGPWIALLGFRLSLPQAPVAPFFRSIPLPRRRFSTRPMDLGSSPCKAPRSVLRQRAEQSMLCKASQSQWWPALQVDYLQLPSVFCTAASIFLPCRHLRVILQILLVRVSSM